MKKTDLVKSLFAFFFLFVFLFLFLAVFKSIPFGQDKMEIGRFYLQKASSDTGSANIVTAVVLGFRGFDTLGEVLVLFLASLGLGLALAEDKPDNSFKASPSLILNLMADLLFPFIILFGIYIFLHGHISPGGGFPAGAVLASGFLLSFLSQKGNFRPQIAQRAEAFSGLVFVVLGVCGLFLSGIFLSNFLPLGKLGNLFSAGIIPLLYSFIGIKVGAELGGVIYHLLEQ